MVTAHSLVLAAVSPQLAALLSADAADAEGGEDEADVADGGDGDGGCDGVSDVSDVSDDGDGDGNDDADDCHCGVAWYKHFVNCSSAQWHLKSVSKHVIVMFYFCNDVLLLQL